MNTPAAGKPRNVVQLTEADVTPFLADAPGMVVVDVSATWCTPCRLLAPIMHKLAAEFPDRMTLVELDGEAANNFSNTHGVESYPQLLFFRDGKLVERESGFHGVEAVTKAVKQALGLKVDDEASDAERAFRDAHAQALSRYEQESETAYIEVGPLFKSIDPDMDALESRYAEDRQAGRISDDDAQKELNAHYERLCAPFADKIAAWKATQKGALEEYEKTMAVAVDRFTGSSASGTTVRAARGAVCRPGDPSCTVIR